MAGSEESLGWLLFKGFLAILGAVFLISVLIWAIKWGLILAAVAAVAYGLFYFMTGGSAEKLDAAIEGDDALGEELAEEPEDLAEIKLDFDLDDEEVDPLAQVEEDELAREIAKAARHK